MGKGTGKFILGAAIGAIAGAAAGILFAPKSGKETRKIIGEKAKDLAEKGKDFAVKEGKEAKELAEKAIDKVKN